MKKLLLFAVLAVLGAGLGYAWRDARSGQPDPSAWQRLVGVRDERQSSPETVFRASYRLISDEYVKPVKAEDLKYAAMQGLLASLGDPHTMFLPPRLAQRFSEETVGNFFGVGARLSPDPLGAKAVSVFEDAPAYRAGMRANDVITAVNGEKVGGLGTDAIVTKVKGPENTFVSLTVIRKGEAKPLTFRIKRGRIQTPTVEGKLLPGTDVGYLQITNFAEPTATQFDRVVEKLEREGMKGLVIDLRGNPGGLLESAADLMSRFVENKTVVTMRRREGDEEVVRSYAGGVRNWSYPLVVLIDEYSASAAEIFAGGLRDYGKATLVGTHTYGKASVQNLYPLTDRASAKITIAKYYLPGGDFIGRKVDEDGVYVSGGVEPVVKVELDLDGDPELGDLKTDNQLQKAVEVVRRGR